MIQIKFKFLALVSLLQFISILSGAQAHAIYVPVNVDYGPSGWHWALNAGVSPTFHYNRAPGLNLPDAVMANVRVSYWYERAIGFYAFAETSSLSFDQDRVFGLGVRLPVITFVAPLTGVKLFRQISLQMMADAVHFKLAGYTGGDPNGITVRGGLSIVWSFFFTKIHLETSTWASSMYNSFYLAPYVGLGIGF